MNKLLPLVLLVLFPLSAHGDCSFTFSGDKMFLDEDCTTETSIVVPHGMTLDCAYNTITAVDPPGGSFLGAVVRNGGAEAHVTQCIVTTFNLKNGCKAGDDRLRGIMLEGASGSVTDNFVQNINKGASGCQEGNAIEIRNAPFDGTHPATKNVSVLSNQVSAWQKTGILANGDLKVTIRGNTVTPSATQANLAANGIQMAYGAAGTIENNNVGGNSWCCTDYVATAVLLIDTAPSIVRNNIMNAGNADVGFYIYSNNVTVENNKAFESGPDGTYDIGFGYWGNNIKAKNNKARGFDISFSPEKGIKDKTLPQPQINN
ncbi:MAG TPA: right-handed parallel beta-helix repeat-containing protein [Thermoanaerobaculia bacterium]